MKLIKNYFLVSMIIGVFTTQELKSIDDQTVECVGSTVSVGLTIGAFVALANLFVNQCLLPMQLAEKQKDMQTTANFVTDKMRSQGMSCKCSAPFIAKNPTGRLGMELSCECTSSNPYLSAATAQAVHEASLEQNQPINYYTLGTCPANQNNYVNTSWFTPGDEN